MSWVQGPLIPFDVESTGLDMDADRIVTGAVIDLCGATRKNLHTWLVAVDVDIPEEATAIHGITTEHARTHGREPAEVIDQMAGQLTTLHRTGAPILCQNAVYDLTLLDRECRRHGLATLEDRLGRPVGPVVDVLVLDRHLDRYRERPSTHKLDDILTTYGGTTDGAHDATNDALAAARAAYLMMRRCHMQPRALAALYKDRYPKRKDGWKLDKLVDRFISIRNLTLIQLHRAQRTWYAEQANNFARFLLGKPLKEQTALLSLAELAGDTDKVTELEAEIAGLRKRAAEVTTDWPLIPYAMTETQKGTP